MLVLNPFRLNDWKINKFLECVFFFQITFLSLIFLDLMGIKIPCLRQIVGFFYISFIPGFLILRILKLHNLGHKSILYSLGLSISTLMFMGLIIGILGPLFGSTKPINLISIIISLTVLTLVLSILAYFIDKRFDEPPFLDIKIRWNILFLLLLPFLGIIGSQMVNYHDNTLLLLLLIPLISLIPILVAWDKIPENLYPITIFITAITLIYHTALISNYIWSYDINVEYHFVKLVLSTSTFHFQISDNVNGMLSVVSLAPIYSLVLNINQTWVFKIIYPLIYSVMPIGLYILYKSQFNKKISFFACFLFIGFSFFYFNAPSGIRQEIAELFLVLILVILLTEDLNDWRNSVLGVIFIFSLVVSHYSISYIWMFIILLTWIITKIISKINQEEYNLINSNFVILFFVFSIAWYIYVTASSNFISMLTVFDHITNSLSSFLNPEYSQGLNVLVSKQYSLSSSIEKYIQILVQFFIAIGVLFVYKLRQINNIKPEYRLFIYLNFILLVAGIIVPQVSNQLNASRLYHICLIILAPVAIMGIIRLLSIIKLSKEKIFKSISIFLVIFILFNTTWIYGVFQDHPHSIRSMTLYQKEID